MAKNKKRTKVDEPVVEAVADVQEEVLDTNVEKETEIVLDTNTSDNVIIEGVEEIESEMTEPAENVVDVDVVEEAATDIKNEVETTVVEPSEKEVKKVKTTNEMFGYNWMGQIYDY